jgi:hypothetical protein
MEFHLCPGHRWPTGKQQCCHSEAVDRGRADAVLLQVGFDDSWSSRSKAPVTDADSYQRSLDALLKALKAAKVPVVLSTPLLLGEWPDAANPADAALDTIAGVNRVSAQREGLPFIDARAVLSQWLSANNSKQKSKGILTRDGETLQRAGWEILLPAVANAFGVAGGVNSTSTAAKGSSGALGVPPENSTVMIVGDKDFAAGTVSGGKKTGWWKQILDLQDAQSGDRAITIYARVNRSGGELFASVPLLVENLDQVTQLQPKRVILGYGFIGANPRRGPGALPSPEQELEGLAEAVKTIAAKGIEVVLLGPSGGRDEESRKRSTEMAALLAGIARSTGAHFIDCAAQEAAFGAPSADRDPVAWRRVIGASLALGLGLDPGTGKKK